ncbi:Carboxypeptidase Taq [Parvibaculum lavamentivorans DS-1]|uniref:Metal-dependent carboxypeptidase n=1 Tax=Parvibaculum lavamentivorans (strain DS-1 / DSM 13023 / NCIMB 13966) TaxID=402881 RepID=A7HQW6_PARL1|nr:carboxypeptidase M32 [Parvibaculum lavamentivorans]ABS62299.1 Carboxypeptidase Taq [Parvibaculum lavamentivorans DS-1]
MSNSTAAYGALKNRFDRLAALQGAQAVLHWDRATMMPEGGARARAEQQAALSLIAHETLTAPEVSELLESAGETVSELDHWDRANLAEMRRIHAHATATPADLVTRLSRQKSATEMLWRKARAANDYASLAPALDELITLIREQAAAKAEAFGLDPYDALLDGYDPGRRAAEIDGLFAELAGFLPGIMRQVMEKQKAALPIEGHFPVDRQERLGREVMGFLGFDFAHGRLDVSHHPFTGGVPEDSRITTRYDEADFTRSLMAVIHETGHSLYERGLPEEWRGQPVGRSRGMTIHESQSLLFEMQAGRSEEFISFLAPRLKEAFGGEGPAWEPDNLLRHYRKVGPSLIRVDADEVTYPLHVILRYRLERQMVAGTLSARDLPAAWNEGMKTLLGTVPPDDASGCMQDIHWPSGSFGYFPTYTLGALAAAQLFAAAKRARPELGERLARGDFTPLVEWVREQVHGQGSRLAPDEILLAATGEPLGTAAFRRHIETRYLS